VLPLRPTYRSTDVVGMWTYRLPTDRPSIAFAELRSVAYSRTLETRTGTGVSGPFALLRPTDVIGAAGFEPATSAPQTRRSNQAELRPVHEEMYGLRGRPWAYAAFDRSTAS
jgi:hypothetical protein